VTADEGYRDIAAARNGWAAHPVRRGHSAGDRRVDHAEQEGFGIGFSPDAEGSTVGYLAAMGGGDLLSGFDLADTARTAVPSLSGNEGGPNRVISSQ